MSCKFRPINYAPESGSGKQLSFGTLDVNLVLSLETLSMPWVFPGLVLPAHHSQEIMLRLQHYKSNPIWRAKLHFKLNVPEVFLKSICISVLFKWSLKSSFSSMRYFFSQRDPFHFLAYCLHLEYDELELPQLLTADNWKIYSCPEKSPGRQQVHLGCIVLEDVDTEISNPWNFTGCLPWNIRRWSCSPITQQRDWFITCFGFTQGISEEDLEFKFSRSSNIQDDEFLVYFWLYFRHSYLLHPYLYHWFNWTLELEPENLHSVYKHRGGEDAEQFCCSVKCNSAAVGCLIIYFLFWVCHIGTDVWGEQCFKQSCRFWATMLLYTSVTVRLWKDLSGFSVIKPVYCYRRDIAKCIFRPIFYCLKYCSLARGSVWVATFLRLCKSVEVAARGLFTEWFSGVFGGPKTHEVFVCEVHDEGKALDLRYLDKGSYENLHESYKIIIITLLLSQRAASLPFFLV